MPLPSSDRVRVRALGTLVMERGRYDAGDTFICTAEEAVGLARSVVVLERLPVLPVQVHVAPEPEQRRQDPQRDRMMRVVKHR